jgi:uncharacterized protein (TIGR03086 family)
MAERGPGGATGLLAGALRYALSVCALVKPAELAAPTPCVEWDIGALLWHLGESVADLEAGLLTGSVDDAGRDDPAPARARRTGDSGSGRESRLLGDPASCPLAVLRDRAAGLLCACYASGPAERFVVVGGLPLPAGLVACTGAVEIAVHGWDVSAALGRGGGIPPRLATRLLALCPLLVVGREGLFAAAVPVSPRASPGDRLVGYLGRDPGAPPWARPGNYRPGSDRRARAGALTGGSGQPPRRLAAP